MTDKKKPKTKLVNLRVDEVSFVDKGANNKTFYLTKAADPTPSPDSEKIVAEPADKKTESILKADGSLDVESPIVKALVEQTAKVAADLAKAEAEKAAQVEIQKALAEKAEVEKALAAERDAKEVETAIRKAAEDFKGLPAKAEELGPDLRAIRKSLPEVADRMETLLKSLKALADKALTPVGESKGADVEVTALDEIQKRAAILKSQDPKLTDAVAFTKVLEADAKLYSRYEAEKAGKGR